MTTVKIDGTVITWKNILGKEFTGTIKEIDNDVLYVETQGGMKIALDTGSNNSFKNALDKKRK